MSDNKFGTTGAGTMNDTLEFVRNFWGSMKVPGMTMPSMSPDDLNKQIADLKAVESWLQMNMNMLRGTIQTLEVQSATLTALQSMSESFAKATSPSAADPKAAKPASKTEPASNNEAFDKMPSSSDFAAHMANPTAWWNTVQQNFSQAVNQAMAPEHKAADNTPTAAKKSAPRKRKAPTKN
ncbi:MAG: hypothetical protein RIQ85_1281 [Pseudomonadota bacterium]